MFTWNYLTFRKGKLYLDNGKLYPSTKDCVFASDSEAEEYLRKIDARANVR